MHFNSQMSVKDAEPKHPGACSRHGPLGRYFLKPTLGIKMNRHSSDPGPRFRVEHGPCLAWPSEPCFAYAGHLQGFPSTNIGDDVLPISGVLDWQEIGDPIQGRFKFQLPRTSRNFQELPFLHVWWCHSSYWSDAHRLWPCFLETWSTMVNISHFHHQIHIASLASYHFLHIIVALRRDRKNDISHHLIIVIFFTGLFYLLKRVHYSIWNLNIDCRF